jgi:hypothetical protein
VEQFIARSGASQDPQKLVEFGRRRLEERIRKVKEVLPLAEQKMRLKVGIGEILAFHSAVYKKADMERIPSDSTAYKVVEDIRDRN